MIFAGRICPILCLRDKSSSQEGWVKIPPILRDTISSSRFCRATLTIRAGVFTLVGLFKFHSVSLCGGLYPLPRRATFRFRNALHLIEARNSVADVGRHFPAAPCVAWKKRTWLRISDHELAWLALPLLSSLGSIPLRTDGPGLFTTHHGSVSSSRSGVVDVIFFSRGFGHARLIHFLLDASEYRLVGFLLRLVFMHICRMSRVQRDYRSIGNRAGILELFSYQAVLNSP